MKPTVFRFFRIGVLVVLGLVETACQSENPVAPSPSVSFSVLDLEVGTGAEATIGSAATVNYSGWLYDAGEPDNKGTLFDSSPGQGFTFVIGLGHVIVGWDQGIVGMRVGGTRRLIIPPDMAYGSRAAGLIPPNSSLVFDVELLGVQ
ncbi:MAG: FKBP-type peptidyl-prolyl cis-trans isomerase [Acidobacteriota bacterium]|nr:FKBP-type peptidyl-prolyl cis-trans isomerase [Acidobacteriota bacterium]